MRPARPVLPEALIWLFFFAVSGFWTVLSWPQGVERLNSDQQNILLMVLKAIKPELYQGDSLFATPAVYDFYTPVFRAYLAKIAGFTGDLASGYRLLVFPLNLIFLLGAYYFFRHLFQRRRLAVLLAFLSSLPFAISGVGEFFGVGPLSMMLPRTAFTAFLPWLLWGFYRSSQDWQKQGLLFFGAGLAANLHPVSGVLLVEIFLLALLIQDRFSRAASFVALIAGLAALLGALPTLWPYLHHTTQMGRDQLPPEIFGAIMHWRFAHNLYPPLNLAGWPGPVVNGLTLLLGLGGLAGLLAFRPLRPEVLWGVCLAILSYLLYDSGASWYLIFLFIVYLAYFRELPLNPDLERTAYLVAAMFWIGILVTLGLQDFWLRHNFLGLAINQIRAVRFAPFFLFILVGFAITLLISRANRSLGKILALIILGGALALQLRLVFRSYIHDRPRPDRVALVELAQWAKIHTPREARFLFDSLTFRLLAERPLTGCQKDGGIWYFAPSGLGEWYEHMQELRAAGGDPRRLQALAHRRGASFFVVPKGPGVLVKGLPIVYENAYYYLIKG